MKRKYKNMIALVLFIASSIDLGYVFLNLCWSIAGLSWFGVITTLLSLTIASTAEEYLYDQMQ